MAAGEADVALSGGGYAWDYAAPKLIVEEAGGRFSDLAGQSRIDSRNALVTNGRLHDEVLEVVRAAADRRLVAAYGVSAPPRLERVAASAASVRTISPAGRAWALACPAPPTG